MLKRETQFSACHWLPADTLTHGAPPNMSGKWFNAVQYGVREQGHLIDCKRWRLADLLEPPRLIIAGGSAYPHTLILSAEIAGRVGRPPGRYDISRAL